MAAVSTAQYTTSALISQTGCQGTVVWGQASQTTGTCTAGCSGSTATLCATSGTIAPVAGLPQGVYVTMFGSSTCSGSPVQGMFYAAGGTNGCQNNGQMSWKATCSSITMYQGTTCSGTAAGTTSSFGCIADPMGNPTKVNVQAIGCPSSGAESYATAAGVVAAGVAAVAALM